MARSRTSEPATLEDVARAVALCERCPRLRAWCTRIAEVRKRAFREQEYWGRPVPGYGDPRARLLIVGLAPAAHGGNRTGRIFTGDSSGNWLYAALHEVGLSNQPDSTGRDDGLRLTDCYVTAAAHCAPPKNKPTKEELDACQSWLETEIRLLPRVRVVIALGRVGWERWLRASGWWSRLAVRERPPFGHGREARLPDGTLLITSYHPSRQNTHTGRLTRGMWQAVFRRARAVLDQESAESGADTGAGARAGIGAGARAGAPPKESDRPSPNAPAKASDRPSPSVTPRASRARSARKGASV